MLSIKNVIEVHNLNVYYGDFQALADFSCKLPENTMIGILGSNGSGKSTFLKAIMGIVPAKSGEVLFWGKSLDQVRDKIAYLPQRSNVDWDFPATVLDVVLMGLYKETGWFGRIQKKHKEKALLYLEKVRMADFAKRHIAELSGGQQQRVFLARAFAQEAELYLLDEPLSGVDFNTEEIIIKTLKELVKSGKTVLMVHHQVETINEYFDYLLMLKNGRVFVSGYVQEALTTYNLQSTYDTKVSIYQ